MNLHHHNGNLYGCSPCPDCGSGDRWPTQKVHPKWPSSVCCDSCGKVESLTEEQIHEMLSDEANYGYAEQSSVVNGRGCQEDE